MPTPVFAYGTLQHPPLLEHLLGRCPALVPARLVGWRAAPLRGRVYPGLVPDASGAADGAVIDVDEADLAVLDVFEGAEYERIGVRVAQRSGEVEAMAWALRPELRSLARPGCWDLRRFVSRDAGVFLGHRTPAADRPGADR